MLSTLSSLQALSIILFAGPALSAGVVPGIPVGPPPSNVSQALDPRLVSFSFEPGFINEFLGNTTSPNKLILGLLSEIEKRTGALGFRPGGITADSTIYNASLGPVLVRDTNPSGGIYRTTYGPEYFASINLLPNTTQVVFDLNFGNDSYPIALEQARAAIQHLGSKLEYFELGNEPDQYTAKERNISTWGPQAYTQEFNTWSTNLTSDLGLPKHFFQAGAMADDPGATPFTTESFVEAGIDAENIGTFSQHMYQYSTCEPGYKEVSSANVLADHKNVTTYVDLWKPQIAAAQSVNATLVIGEFNSVSCSGRQNVSNTFAQALWLADTILYSASINIKRMYSHQGATLLLQSSDQANSAGYSWYDAFYPQASSRNGPAGATPSYAGYLLVAEAVSRTANTSHLGYYPLESHPSLAIYPIWDSASRPVAQGPARIVLLNMGGTNETVSLAGLGAGSLKRLRSPSLENQNSTLVTWAGQSFQEGKPSGTVSIETVAANGEVAISAYEGVLVFLGNTTAEAVAGGNGTTASVDAGKGSSSSTSSASRGASIATLTQMGLAVIGLSLFLH